MTLDKIFAEVKNLSADDFTTLLDGMLIERTQREEEQKREAWNQVWEAICFYTKHYGDIFIIDSLGCQHITLNDVTGFRSSTQGEIEI